MSRRKMKIAILKCEKFYFRFQNYYEDENEVEYVCICQETFRRQFDEFLNLPGAPSCNNCKKSGVRKYAYDDIKKTFDDAGCKLISKEYINSKVKLEYICNCGGKSSIRYRAFCAGKRCINCRSLRACKKNAAKRNGTLTVAQMRSKLKELKFRGYTSLNKQQLIEKLKEYE